MRNRVWSVVPLLFSITLGASRLRLQPGGTDRRRRVPWPDALLGPPWLSGTAFGPLPRFLAAEGPPHRFAPKEKPASLLGQRASRRPRRQAVRRSIFSFGRIESHPTN